MRAILSSLALITATSGAAAEIHRDALWIVLQSCVIAKKTAGISFPCLNVNLGSSTDPGFAALRAPLSATRVLVMPIERVEGIESPILQRPDASAYWRAAIGAPLFLPPPLRGRAPLR